MRIFLDANILFSAAKSDGAMRAFLDKLRIPNPPVEFKDCLEVPQFPIRGMATGVGFLPWLS